MWFAFTFGAAPDSRSRPTGRLRLPVQNVAMQRLVPHNAQVRAAIRSDTVCGKNVDRDTSKPYGRFRNNRRRVKPAGLLKSLWAGGSGGRFLARNATRQNLSDARQAGSDRRAALRRETRDDCAGEG